MVDIKQIYFVGIIYKTHEFCAVKQIKLFNAHMFVLHTLQIHIGSKIYKIHIFAVSNG